MPPEVKIDEKPPTVPVVEDLAGDPPVDAGGGGVDLAATIKEAISDGFKGLFGRGVDGGPRTGDVDEDDDRDGPVTAPGKTAARNTSRLKPSASMTSSAATTATSAASSSGAQSGSKNSGA